MRGIRVHMSVRSISLDARNALLKHLYYYPYLVSIHTYPYYLHMYIIYSECGSALVTVN